MCVTSQVTMYMANLELLGVEYSDFGIDKEIVSNKKH